MKRYILELSVALIVYGLSFVLAAYVHGYTDLGPHYPILLALLPTPATVLVAWVVWRNLRLMDEMQLRQQLEALGIGFALTALVTFNYGFLEAVGLPRQSAFWVWPLMACCWMLSQIIVKLRYR
ncbi:hypothetical protein [Thalassobius sp. Cn5-15]|uniref:hypothetical protein n=1 Tax=Thalassobius sp. Cn5-15 TaxID=2917763 RepID=UPI001EF318CB|nr:hypothetical protein [Thalassobius sp. Cn5-15]MCG7495110.1 hypothetical protein [Thalassobius sp. Cn5-15]